LSLEENAGIEMRESAARGLGGEKTREFGLYPFDGGLSLFRKRKKV